MFEDLKRIVQGAIGLVTIEHVGSTSIPGVGGRNALDVAIAVEDNAQSAIREAMHQLGFQDSPFPLYLPLMVGQLPFQGSNSPYFFTSLPRSRRCMETGSRFVITCEHTLLMRRHMTRLSGKQFSMAKSRVNGIKKPRNLFLLLSPPSSASEARANRVV